MDKLDKWPKKFCKVSKDVCTRHLALVIFHRKSSSLSDCSVTVVKRPPRSKKNMMAQWQGVLILTEHYLLTQSVQIQFLQNKKVYKTSAFLNQTFYCKYLKMLAFGLVVLLLLSMPTYIFDFKILFYCRWKKHTPCKWPPFLCLSIQWNTPHT